MEQGLVWEGVVRKIITIAGIFGLSLCWAVMPAGAGNSPHFDSTPSSGPPGTVIHASDTNFNCDQPGANVVVKLIAGEVVIAHTNATVNSGLDVGGRRDRPERRGARRGHAHRQVHR